MNKYPTECSNLYKEVDGGSCITIFSKDESKLVDNSFPDRILWFVKFVRGEKFRVGIIRKQYFGVSTLIFMALKITWENK